MGQKIVLTDTFTDTSLPKLRDDPLLNAGSLAMLDLSHSLGTPGAGVPANNATVPNIAYKEAAAILGSGTAASLAWTFENTLGGTEGEFERTTKGALHGVVSQVNQVVNHRADFFLPSALREYLRLNPTREYAIWFWYQVTRTSPNNSNMVEGVHGNTTSIASNQLFTVGFTNAVTGAPARTSQDRATGWSGTVPTTDVNVAENLPAWGNARGYGSTNNNNGKSFVLYRTHVVDVALSGKTFAQLDAADLALFNSLFGVGGRLNGDTWSFVPASFP